MALLFKSDIERESDWRRAFAQHLPNLEVRLWPEIGDPAEIDYALMWNPERGELARYPNLKVIFSVGAGVDHLMKEEPQTSSPERYADRSRPMDRRFLEDLVEWINTHGG